MKKLFENQSIDVVVEGRSILFNVDDVAYAVGYAKPASLEHHIKGTKYDVIAKNGKRYTTKDGLKYAAKLANRTPMLKRLADWASKFKLADLVAAQIKSVTKPSPTPTYVLYGIKEAATKLGMTTKEFSDWLVAQGYAGRYVSNGAVFWKDWFRDQGMGTRPLIGDGKDLRESNVAKLTQRGYEFVKNRLNSERQTNVLSFAKKEASEAEKLEKEVDDLIKDTFKDVRGDLLGDDYEMSEVQLLYRVKSIIAQVKLKEKKT